MNEVFSSKLMLAPVVLVKMISCPAHARLLIILAAAWLS